jgi:hypothetical protein
MIRRPANVVLQFLSGACRHNNRGTDHGFGLIDQAEEKYGGMPPIMLISLALRATLKRVSRKPLSEPVFTQYCQRR